MFTFIAKLLVNFSANHGTSFLSAPSLKLLGQSILNLLAIVWNFILGILWWAIKFALGILDVFQYIVVKFIGIDFSLGNITDLQNIHRGTTNYYDMIFKIFRALFAVAIVLMIVFSIFAMIKQEYQLVQEQKVSPEKNAKMPIISKIFKCIVTIILMPLVFYIIIAGTSSILTSFYRAIGNDEDVSIGGQVLAASTYDANRYRAYARNNQRIPITISVYDINNVKSDSEINDKKVQEKLKILAGNFADSSFLSFKDSTLYNGNSWKSFDLTYNDETLSNASKYFENFVCTREQYYIMAEFIDYCQLHNMNFYIKAITEGDICWKYVDNTVLNVNQNTISPKNGTWNGDGEISLTINYRDANAVNSISDTAFAANGNKNETYSLTISTENKVTSKISDAMTTISALLGIDDYNAMFNTMERDDSGDYTNLVSWANEKVRLKLSNDFNLNDSNTWTKTDQIIVYEYYHFSSNNTLQNYTLDQLKETGALIDIVELTYRNFNAFTSTYSYPKSLYCVKLNGSYYRVEKNMDDTDDFGNYYYKLVGADVNYFTAGETTIKKVAETTIKLSDEDHFNINDLKNCSVSDQILVYEYFKDLTIANELRAHKFSEFETGVEFSVYEIKDPTTNYYIYINGTFYQVTGSGTSYSLCNGGVSKFLVDSTADQSVYFSYSLTLNEDFMNIYGMPKVNTDESIFKKYLVSSTDFESISADDPLYNKYSKVNLKLSNDFDYTNVETWTYRDYLLFYIAATSGLNCNIDTLKILGISGAVGTYLNKYVLKTRDTVSIDGISYYYLIYLDNFINVSDLKMCQTLNDSIYSEYSLDKSNVGLELTYNESTDILLTAETRYQDFYISEQFDEYNPQSWTIGDFFLCYLRENNVINTSLSQIKTQGYRSLIYRIKIDGKDVDFYRFGQPQGLNHDNVFFFDSRKIPEGYTLDSFFHADLMSYIMLKNNCSTSSLYQEENEFLTKVCGEYSGYIYNINTNMVANNSLIGTLVEEYIGDQTKNLTKYTYQNLAFSKQNLSTWTNVDLILYSILGLTDGTYTSNLIKSTDDKIYFIVGNYAINISDGSPFECDINSSNNVILSKSMKSFDTINDLKSYYSNNKTAIGVANSSSSYTLSTTSLKYTSNYYLNNFQAGASYTALDIAILFNSVGTANKTYRFYLYTDTSSEYYIKLNETYIKIIDSVISENSNITYVLKNTITSNQSNAFAVDSTYTVDTNNLTYIDAIIYGASYQIPTGTYTVYSWGDKKYLYLNNIFVTYDDNKNEEVVFSDIISTDSFKNDKILRFLFENFYASRVVASSAVPETNSSVDLIDTRNTALQNLDALNALRLTSNNFNTWTPVSVIFKSVGVFEDLEKTYESLILSWKSSSDRTYIYIKYVLKTSEIKEYYFDVTDLAQLSSGGTLIEISNDAIKQLKLNVAALTYDETAANKNQYEFEVYEQNDGVSTSHYVKINDSYVKIDSIKVSFDGEITSTLVGADGKFGSESQLLGNTELEGLLLSNAVLHNMDYVGSYLYSTGNSLNTFSSEIGYTYIDAFIYRFGIQQIISGVSSIVENYLTFESDLLFFRNNSTHVLENGNSLKYQINNFNLDDISTWNWVNLVNLYFNSNEKVTAENPIYLDRYYACGETFLKIGNIYLLLNSNSQSIFVSSGDSVASYESNKRIVDLIVEKKDKKLTGHTYKSITLKGISKPLYYFSDVNGNKYGIYNLVSTDSASFTYYKNATESVSDLSQANQFYYTTKSLGDLKNWNVLDFVIAYVTGDTDSRNVVSYICRFNNKDYINFNGKYILLFNDLLINFKVDGTEYKIYSDKKIIDLLQDIFLLGGGANETELSAYYGSLKNISEKIKEHDASVKLNQQTLYFSSLNPENEVDLEELIDTNRFTLSDYSTWSVSDYIIYHIFTSGAYSSDVANSDTFSIAYKYNYTAKYNETNIEYSNLTYFDLAYYKAFGSMPTIDQTYEFDLYKESSSNAFYLLINGKYFKLNEYISVDFSSKIIKSEIYGSVKNDTAEKNSAVSKIVTEGCVTFTTSSSSKSIYKEKFSTKNIQTIVNNLGAPVYTYYLLKQNEDGSVDTYHVINFQNSSNTGRSKDSTGKDEIYYDLDVFNNYVGMKFNNISTSNVLRGKVTNSVDQTTVPNHNYKYDESGSDRKSNSKFVLKVTYDQIIPQFIFDNYYYFNVNLSVLNSMGIINDSNDLQQDIINEEAEISQDQINLKLSSGFNINDCSTWTILDYIIIYESSRNIKHNKFSGMDYKEIKTEDYWVSLYKGVTEDSRILYINDNFYELGYNIDLEEKLIDITSSPLLSEGTVNDYSFKFLFDQLYLSLNTHYTGSKLIVNDGNTISYITNDEITHVRKLNMDVAYTAYKVNIDDFATYSTQNVIKQVSWVEKLMTDMKVLYPDLNWATLLATDGWVDTLGDYVSAYSTGLYITDSNSSNITAAGLVLSEFFVSVATPVVGSYADYEYSSMFNEEQIHALMREIVGVDNFDNLVREAKIFMNFFNSSFAPILDDLAFEFADEVNSGSLRMCIYKSFLTTMLLSSDIGEYLYTIATRVYAEYTVQEYLALASGDYSNYYFYVNRINDEEGNEVNGFKYSSFAELVKYENTVCANTIPTFSFNVKKVFNALAENNKFDSVTYEDLMGAYYDTPTYDKVIYSLVKSLNAKYKSVYVDERSQIEDEDDIYCYMLHIYWSIKAEIGNLTEPIYLTHYYKYLIGDMVRWNIIDDIDCDGSEQYYQNYSSYSSKLSLYKALALVSIVKLYLPDVTFDVNSEGSGFLNLLKNIADVIFHPSKIDVTIPAVDAAAMLSGGSVGNEAKLIKQNALSLYFNMNLSENGSSGLSEQIEEVLESFMSNNAIKSSVETGWNSIVEYEQYFEHVIEELDALREIQAGETTENGTVRSALYTDKSIDGIKERFNSVLTNLKNYIAAQQRIDEMQKRSITFTLAQYSANYVPTGFSFNIQNRDYKFDSTVVDTRMLAEYVYGGAKVEAIGGEAIWTSSDTLGMIESAKVYDNIDKKLKTELISWKNLRTFASRFAEYTAKVYYLTNLSDLSINNPNAVRITDMLEGSVYKYENSVNVTSVNMNTTEEYQILYYIITGTDISIDKLCSLIVGNEKITGVFSGNSQKLISYINGTIDTISEDEKIKGLIDYLYFVQTANYVGKAKTYYVGTQAEVIHQIFTKVMADLLMVDYSFDEFATKNLLTETEINSGATRPFYEITFEEFKRLIIKKIIANEQIEAESVDEKTNRYLCLLNLICYEMNLYANGSYIGRMVYKNDVSRNASNQLTFIGDLSNVSLYSSSSSISLTSTFSDNTYRNIVSLSGLDNRPTYEFVSAEYKQQAGVVKDHYDESEGDVFIVCVFDEDYNYYVPLMMSNNCTVNSSGFQKYIEDGFPVINTEYIASDGYYPIIAKGIIDASGYPTAIYKTKDPIAVEGSDKTYNPVYFYRTTLGANTGKGDKLVNVSKAATKVTTNNYTKYVSSTSFTMGTGTSVTYTGKSSLNTVVTSDIKANYVQIKTQYLISDATAKIGVGTGAISVLDDFSCFYTLGGASMFLLIMSLFILFPLLFNATGSVLRRIFDLTLLFMVSPVVVATKTLPGKNSTYSKWETNVFGTLISCIGYIIGFSSYFILVSSILKIDAFISPATYMSIMSIGGIGKYLSYDLLNSLIRCFWILTAVVAIENVPKLMLPIITNGKVKSVEPPLGSGGTFSKKLTGLSKEVQAMIGKAGSVISGKALLGLKDAAIENAKAMVPGGVAIDAAGKGIKALKNSAAKKDAAAVEKALAAYGVDPKQASSASSAIIKKRNEMKKGQDKRRKENMKAFSNLFK